MGSARANECGSLYHTVYRISGYLPKDTWSLLQEGFEVIEFQIQLK